MDYLKTINISKQYAKHTALSNVNITVKKGSVYGLLGPNGAGKTTLIRIINRITAPDSGEVFIEGRALNQKDVFNIGYLPEERGLYKKMKTIEQAIFLAQLKGLSKNDAKKRVFHWFEKFDILSWKDRKVEELSKGMQQKIQFITTVIHDPELLILDEPFSGFDPVNAELLKREILELRQRGKTIILSTHNMESVESLCDEISLINNSKVVLHGAVREIKQKHRKHIYRLQIIGEHISLESLQCVVLSQTVKDGISIYHIQKKDLESSNSKMLKDLATKYEILSFEEILPSMNELFINTIKGNEQ